MSVEALRDFGKRVLEDPELKQKAKEIGIANVDGIIDLAKQNGFEISKEDFENLAKEFKANDELSEEDLDKVAGGIITVGLAAAAGLATAVGSLVATEADDW